MRINYKRLAIGGLALNLSMLEMSPSHAAKQRMVCPSDGKRPMFNTICPGGDEPITIEEYENSRPPSDHPNPPPVVKEPKRRPVDTDGCDTSRAPEGGESPCPLQPSVISSRQSFEPEMVSIPAGCFQMGSPESENGRSDDEGPQHRVCVEAFAMGKYEVTQGEWQAVMGNNPSSFKDCGERCPVENVSWNDVQDYITKLNAKTGKNYRLPTEAEWEYAARAGTSTRFSFGNDDSNLGNYAWFSGNSNSKTHPVGKKQPNPWGLYDMHGRNQDKWHSSYSGAPTDGSAWEVGDSNSHLLRGCSWVNEPDFCRSAFRYDNGFYSYYDGGVRVASVVSR